MQIHLLAKIYKELPKKWHLQSFADMYRARRKFECLKGKFPTEVEQGSGTVNKYFFHSLCWCHTFHIFVIFLGDFLVLHGLPPSLVLKSCLVSLSKGGNVPSEENTCVSYELCSVDYELKANESATYIK